jgi:hypothetical protein
MDKDRLKFWDYLILIIGIGLLMLMINCTKPQDYCDEAHKYYYYDFDLKKPMTFSIQECYLYNREKSKPMFCPI